MITILNTSILTAHGQYQYWPVLLSTAHDLVRYGYDSQIFYSGGIPGNTVTHGYRLHGADSSATPPVIQSAVGHQSTADVISELLGIAVPMNRIEYRQQPGDMALVFKMRGRAPEGKILTREEIDAIGYDFGLLFRFE